MTVCLSGGAPGDASDLRSSWKAGEEMSYRSSAGSSSVSVRNRTPNSTFDLGGAHAWQALAVGTRLNLPLRVGRTLFSVGYTHAVQQDGAVCGMVEPDRRIPEMVDAPEWRAWAWLPEAAVQR